MEKKKNNYSKNYHKKIYYKNTNKFYKKNNNIYCGNCGKIGHIYRDCNEPIISLGIILYRINNGKKEYLLIMRKDTLGYVELIRGNYPLNDINYLENIVEEMTLDEKYKINHNTFEELWNNLWVENEEKKIKYRNEYYKSMINFNKLTNGFSISGKIINLKEIINNSKTNWIEPEWGFPKGRRNLRENNINCAIREFEEETDISRDDISIKVDIKPLSEEFIGSNNKIYKHIYYIAKMDKIKTPYINKEKTIQLIEVGDIKWCSLEECMDKIRNYDISKKKVLIEADNIINWIENIKPNSKVVKNNLILDLNQNNTNNLNNSIKLNQNI